MRDLGLLHPGTMRPDGQRYAGGYDRHDTSGIRGLVSGERWRALWPRAPWLAGLLCQTGLPDEAAGPLPGGGQRASGTGGTHGRLVGTHGGGIPGQGPRFDLEISPNGYVWWYLDALSDDSAFGIVIIGFIGSVFSPYYAFARRSGKANPANHCAVNVALYGPRHSRWAMTERGHTQLARDAASLTIGPSQMRWDGETLTVAIDEIAVPLPRKIRGTVRLRPDAITTNAYGLDDRGQHSWWPMAPRARVEVELDHPDLRWSGHGYFDTNAGTEPLEAGFRRWDWSRAALADGSSAILYDTEQKNGTTRGLALRFGPDGTVSEFDPPPQQALPPTLWRVNRKTRADREGKLAVRQTLEDAPFYSRAVLDTHLLGMPATAVHESLSLDRFARPVVQAMLPFRMPRRSR